MPNNRPIALRPYCLSQTVIPVAEGKVLPVPVVLTVIALPSGDTTLVPTAMSLPSLKRPKMMVLASTSVAALASTAESPVFGWGCPS
jgi:hypothetical protein